MNNNLTGIVIDAGHGGIDSGAVGNGIVEKDLTLEISKYMFDRFKELGIPVALTRSTDEELTSQTRPRRVLDAFGNGANVIVISNHINAGSGEGAEVIYSLRNNSTLAKKILNNLAQEGQIIRKYYQRRLPSNPAKDYYYIMRETPNTEALIVEYGFLDNKKDAVKLKENYKDYAEAVVRAIMEYKNLSYNPVTGSDVYTVKPGDTLWTIARKNDLSVEKIKEINNLTSNLLSVGQTLKLSVGPTSVPGSGSELIEDDNEYYIVKKGDTLYSIANLYGLTVNELKDINNLNTNTLSIGEKLIVKTKDEEEVNDQQTIYVVKPGDTLYQIAKTFNIDVEDIKSVNNLDNNILSIGQNLIIPSNIQYNVYTVKRGDTLYQIAMNNNITVENLKKINTLNSNVLSIGQKLLIPII